MRKEERLQIRKDVLKLLQELILAPTRELTKLLRPYYEGLRRPYETAQLRGYSSPAYPPIREILNELYEDGEIDKIYINSYWVWVLPEYKDEVIRTLMKLDPDDYLDLGDYYRFEFRNKSLGRVVQLVRRRLRT